MPMQRLLITSAAILSCLTAPHALADGWPTPSDQSIAELKQLLHDGSDAAALKAANVALATAPNPLPTDVSDPRVAQLCDLTAVANLRAGTPIVAQRYARLAVTSPQATREMKLNLASAELQMPASQTHAIKSLADICESQPSDEVAVNLFGLALDNASKSKADAKLMQPFSTKYAALVVRLEKDRPGEQRRWGDTWVSRDKFVRLNDKRKEALDRVSELELKLKTKQEKIEAENETYDKEYGKKVKHQKAGGERSTSADNAHAKVVSARELRDLQDKLDLAKADVPALPWTVSIRGLLDD